MKNLTPNYINSENRHYAHHKLPKIVSWKRHIILVLLAILIILAFSAVAQEEPSKTDAAPNKMEFFEFMIGEWTGPVDIPNTDGTTRRINQHEKVELKLKNTLVHIEGTGTGEDGNIEFSALATIFYDAKEDAYKMFAFRDNGQFTPAAIVIIGEQHFNWSFSPNEFTHIKYELEVKDNLWAEKGYFSKDGQNWSSFFEMELKKTDE